ncbi:O-antigen ligase family protein [bacterium]|nr:O-antigen ligase family protein [bacterium]RIK75357.1 MAG: hypothetical protein DCC62_13485 [candidate division KSB1 bacterium]
MEPLLFKTRIIGVVFFAAIFIAGFLLTTNRRRFLLAYGTITAGFQIELLLTYFGAVITLSYLAFLALLIYSFIEPKRDIKHPKPRVLWPWLGMLFFAALAVTKAIDPNMARAPFVMFAFDVIMFFAVLRTVKTSGDVRFYVGCLMAAIIVQSMIGLLQYKFPFFKIGVIDHYQSYMWWRAKGTFFHANHYGMFLLLTLPLALRYLINAMAERNAKWMMYGFATFGIGLVALLASYNRGSWGGLVFGLLIMLAVDFTKRGVKIRRILSNLLALAFLGVGLLSIKFAPKIYDRVFQDDAEGQLEGRGEQIDEAIPLILSNPVVGVGYNNDRFYASVIFVHNVYMLIAAEIGIPGLLCFLWFMLEILREIWAVSRSSVLYCANYARGALAGMLGFCLAGWVGPDFWINYGVQSYFWLVLALLFAVSRLKRVVLFKQKQMALAQKNKRSPQPHETNLSQS